MEDDPEPLERLEEILAHPADTTFHALHHKGLQAKKGLAEERTRLDWLLNQLTHPRPEGEYAQIQIEIQEIKKRVSQKHDELMEILKTEEKIIREIQEKRI